MLAVRVWAAALSLSLAAACTGGSGAEEFAIQLIDLPANGVWQINRPITITFTQPVDKQSVSLNTINVRELNGAPATGEFHFTAPHVVVFQPRCPLLEDLSDAGLAPGGVEYELKVLGKLQSAGLTVRSLSGQALAHGDVRRFRTPVSEQPLELFHDARIGPPVPLVRSASPADMALDACYVELGGDPTARVYFRLDDLGVGKLDPPGGLPLNRLSAHDEQVALVLHFDQAVDPGALNVSAERLTWQFDAAPLGAAPQWTDLATKVELVANCTASGAQVRIEPLGILPPDTGLRVVVAPNFADIVGQTGLLAQSEFALAATGLAPQPRTDEHHDAYASAAGLDLTLGLADPPAGVEEGRLRANFSFEGSGGLHGDFDWLVPSGQTKTFDTDSQVIVGGPDFLQQNAVTVVGGVLDVRRLRIESGATLKVQGSKPLTILASGTVEILGTLDIRGGDSPGVISLNITNVPELGAAGVAGGGRGGTGSPLTTSSSPKGGNGFGAFGAADGGGAGGETGWTNQDQQVASRRGAGGGGGRFGRDQAQTGPSELGLWDQSFVGLDAEPGFNNLAEKASGATSGLVGPLGGAVGPSPFVDSDPGNDFYGKAVVGSALIQGELAKPWAGSGGGGGGDAAFVPGGGSFPAVPFKFDGNERGGGGGGGGGSLSIQCLGDIVFGEHGLILCRGGSGGGGENTGNVNRVGGGGGGGSGGHVVLQTAGVIDLSLVAGPDPSFSGMGTLLGGILATGGQGAAGAGDLGGATLEQIGKQDTAPRNDACPKNPDGSDYPTQNANACRGHIDGAGGDGGPGLVQLHTPDGLASVLLPPGLTLADVCKPRPLFTDGSGKLVPSFGRLSRVRSKWIALGHGGFEKSGGTYVDAAFRFEGTDPVSGRVLDDGAGGVPLLAALAPQATIVAAPGVPSILSAHGVVIGTQGFDPAYAYVLQHTAQLAGFQLRLSSGGASQRFDVVAAVHDPLAQSLTLQLDPEGPPASGSFGPGALVSLHPAYFRIYSDASPDALPASSSISIHVAATLGDPATGLPDEAAATDFVADVGELDLHPQNAQFRFLRYEVLFDLAADGGPLSATSPVPALEFLRLPFRYD